MFCTTCLTCALEMHRSEAKDCTVHSKSQGYNLFRLCELLQFWRVDPLERGEDHLVETQEGLEIEVGLRTDLGCERVQTLWILPDPDPDPHPPGSFNPDISFHISEVKSFLPLRDPLGLLGGRWKNRVQQRAAGSSWIGGVDKRGWRRVWLQLQRRPEQVKKKSEVRERSSTRQRRGSGSRASAGGSEMKLKKKTGVRTRTGTGKAHPVYNPTTDLVTGYEFCPWSPTFACLDVYSLVPRGTLVPYSAAVNLAEGL
ncbi:hypothetical protein M9H77_02762 [Catharanthus roseus]|uniref:Uncharacterized protein n=1 Tax=Catharanthus roseus TaxID=4058 RepID=A0ACC0C9G0_CATRO|nr:hypothetical protein M9H77_02762 [Catharanthus roseus]